MWTSTFYGHWDYWELEDKVTFNGPEKLIEVVPGITSLSVQADIYSAFKRWVQLNDNAKYLEAIIAIGGQELRPGEFLDSTFFLVNGWKLKPYPGSYDLVITGNIVSEDQSPIRVDADEPDMGSNNINIATNSSVIVRQVETGSGGSGSFTQEDRSNLVTVRDKVFAIEGILEGTITARLEEAQAAQITDLQSKLKDLWELHGLNTAKPVTVSPTGRSVGDITQNITESGDTVTVTRE